MKSKITITNVKNIDYQKMEVIDNSKVITKIHDSDMDVFAFYNEIEKKYRKANLMDVSLYNDLIVENDEQYKILHMLSKNNF